jgi:hypothetical protein
MKRKIVCPQCRKEAPWEGNPWRPFCSERCKMIDLGMWASEEYRIPGEKAEQEEEKPGKTASGNREGEHERGGHSGTREGRP